MTGPRKGIQLKQLYYLVREEDEMFLNCLFVRIFLIGFSFLKLLLFLFCSYSYSYSIILAQRKKPIQRFNVEEALAFCIDSDNEDLET